MHTHTYIQDVELYIKLRYYKTILLEIILDRLNK